MNGRHKDAAIDAADNLDAQRFRQSSKTNPELDEIFLNEYENTNFD